MTTNDTPSCPTCHSKNLVYAPRGRMDANKWTTYFWVSCAACGAQVGIMDHRPPEAPAKDDTAPTYLHWPVAA